MLHQVHFHLPASAIAGAGPEQLEVDGPARQHLAQGQFGLLHTCCVAGIMCQVFEITEMAVEQIESGDYDPSFLTSV